MLTLQKLKDMEDGKIFRSGMTPDNYTGVHIPGTGAMLRWIAKRGDEYHDWCIYISLTLLDDMQIAMHGDKVHNPKKIKNLIECDDESFKMYRH